MDPNLPPKPLEPSINTQPVVPVQPPVSPEQSIPKPAPTPQSNTQPTAEIATNQKWYKAIVFLFIFFLLIALGMGLFYLYQKYQNEKAPVTVTPMPTVAAIVTPSPSPDPFLGWKTFSNTTYKYSLKYPGTWKTQAIGAGAGAKEAKADSNGLDISEVGVKRTYPYGVFTIQGFTKPTDKNYVKWTKSEITLGEVKATKYESLTKKDLKSVAITIKTPGGKYLEILFRETPDNKNWTIFSQILSTFTFLDGLDPTGWKLFNNSKYYYQVSYPTDLKLTKTSDDLDGFTAEDIKLEVEVGKEEINELNALDEYFYLDTPITRTSTVGGIKANIYELTDQIVYVTLYSKHYYTIIFKGDTKMSEAELLILSTFKFLTPSPSPLPSPIR